jgi:chromosome segregation ATPase
VDQSGNVIVAMLRRAADLSNENCDRARTMANELARQLQAAEDRISQLETEVDHFQNRAVRAETWLQQIQREIEEKLISPMAASRPKSTP